LYQITYFTAEGVTSTVFESQVRSLINRLRSIGIPVKSVILQPFKPLLRPANFINFIKEILKRESIIYLKPDFKNVSQAVSFAQSRGKRLLQHLGSTPLIFHCRGPEAALLGSEIARLRASKTPVLFDVRGLAVDEYKNKDIDRATYFTNLENKISREVDGFSFVSHQLKEIFQNRYDIDTKPFGINIASYNENIFFYDSTKRHEVRTRMNWHNKIVFVYAGGSQEYQSVSRILEAFKELSLIYPNAHLLLLLARPIRRFKKQLFNLGIHLSKVSCFTNVPYSHVPRYLNAADWGLIFRTSESINEVATPTKVAEYFGCGLRVIYGSQSGYYGTFIQNNPDLGIVVPFSTNLSSLLVSEESDDRRKQISAIARKYLSMSVTIEGYKTLYQQLL
jgi:glycosyltransferase involved in cell wall biosynthesis